MSKNVTQLSNFKLPTAPGIHHRLLCMTGKNKGVSYFLEGNRVVMGRGDKADIMVIDNKSSREHAELQRFKNTYVVTDLGSQNGLIVNDLKIGQQSLKDADTIIIGKTVFKYNIVNVDDPQKKALVEAKNTDEDDDEEEEDTKETNLSEHELAEKQKQKTRVRLVLFGCVGVLLYMFMGDEKPKKKRVYSKKNMTGLQDATDSFTELVQKKMREEDNEIKGKLDVILHRGQRELREGNFFRAIAEFNLALILSPKNGRASYYLNKAQQNLDAEIDVHFQRARQETEALKYESAFISYCSVIRLLEKYPEHEDYQAALKNITTVEEKMGVEVGTTECFGDKSRDSK
ncbi:MAG: FHA domain-containing protein [Bacteriovoracaceae bacterium]|nr:FHA domain-containing protein [Bacteriovoracaceae bacterium]